MSCYFTKKWFHYRRFPSNLKNSRNTHRKSLRWCQFSLNLYVNGLDSSNCLSATKDVLLEIFRNFQNLLLCKSCCFNQITSLYRPLSGKLPTISEHSKETFLLESVCAKVRNSGLQACNVRKKGTVLPIIFWNFQNFRTSFLSLALLEKYQ